MIQMTETDKLTRKQRLLKVCMQRQQDQITAAKKSMDEMQESANEQQGSMEDKFESFREACQNQRDMFAKHLDEAISGLAILKRIVATKLNKEVTLGSVVHTNSANFFISVSLGEIVSDEEKYFAISPMSPLFKAMADKKAGEKFSFRNTDYVIKEVF